MGCMKTFYIALNVVKTLSLATFAVVNVYWMGQNIKKNNGKIV